MGKRGLFDRGWRGGPEKDAADSNPQAAPRLTRFSSRAATYVSRACEKEAKLRPPPSLAGKLQVGGCWNPAALPRARPVPPEVPDWRAAGAGSSSAAFQSSLGTPPSVGVASAEGGRREHTGPGYSSARGARRCRAAGCKLCAALQELRNSRALQPRRTAPRRPAAAGASRAPRGRRRGGRCCHFLEPAPRREEEC